MLGVLDAPPPSQAHGNAGLAGWQGPLHPKPHASSRPHARMSPQHDPTCRTGPLHFWHWRLTQGMGYCP